MLLSAEWLHPDWGRVTSEANVMPWGVRLYQNPRFHSLQRTMKTSRFVPRKSCTEAVPELMESRTVEKIRFARGKARKSPWCEAEHRVIDWVSRSPNGEFEVVIMIEGMTEEMHGSD